MNVMADAPRVPVVDNLHAPEVFSDGALSLGLIGGCMRIALYSYRYPQGPEHPEPPQRVVIGRLLLPIAAAQALAVDLHDFLTKQGLSPTKAFVGDATAQ
jgi:hypothetical protein